MREWFETNDSKWTGGAGLNHGAHGPVRRENAVLPRREDALADRDFVIVAHVFHRQGLARSAHRALNARSGDHRPRTALPVGDQQYLRRVAIHFDGFSHGAVRGDDSHIALQSVTLPAVNIDRLARGIGARPDNLGRDHGHVAMRLAEAPPAFQPVNLRAPPFQSSLPHLYSLQFALHFLI